ncbi:MAG TPA: hypothetical protein VF695_16515 [Sphingomonas sp.]|jgi:hypothetical protein
MVARTEQWDGAVVRTWLQSRVIAARADQVVAERGGRERQDDCDRATAEEMVCSLVAGSASDSRASLLEALRVLLDRDDYVWRGIYDDTRFDRHVRSFIKKLVRMTKANDGFTNVAHYQ